MVLHRRCECRYIDRRTLVRVHDFRHGIRGPRRHQLLSTLLVRVSPDAYDAVIAPDHEQTDVGVVDRLELRDLGAGRIVVREDVETLAAALLFGIVEDADRGMVIGGDQHVLVWMEHDTRGRLPLGIEVGDFDVTRLHRVRVSQFARVVQHRLVTCVAPLDLSQLCHARCRCGVIDARHKQRLVERRVRLVEDTRLRHRPHRIVRTLVEGDTRTRRTRGFHFGRAGLHRLDEATLLGRTTLTTGRNATGCMG